MHKDRAHVARSHLVAINCHPFHCPEAIQTGLSSAAQAARLLRQSQKGTVDTFLFWHGRVSIPKALATAANDLGIQVHTTDHVSNGRNLNRQIEFAIAQNYDYFYRVDGDDEVFTHRFVQQARALSQENWDICGGALRYELRDGATFSVSPPPHPDVRDFLENRYILHPSMAFRVAAFKTSGLRYWPHRLEDKALIRDAIVNGLRIGNISDVLGSYRLERATRNGFAPKWLGLRLNLSFLSQRHAYALMPYALALFIAQVVLGSQFLRAMRQKRYRVGTKAPSTSTPRIPVKHDE